MAINAVWHAANPMPPNASRKQRLNWHLQHAAACGCRPIPPDLLEEMKNRAAGQKLADIPAEVRDTAADSNPKVGLANRKP